MQLQQSKGIRDYRSAFTYANRNILLSQGEFLGEAPISLSLFDRVQVFALEIFNQRHFQNVTIRGISDDDRRLAEAELICGSPTAFSGDLFALSINAADKER